MATAGGVNISLYQNSFDARPNPVRVRLPMKLPIADNLLLPIEAVTEKLGFLGRTGQGKSYAAQRLAELMHEAGAQFIALDPVGIWASLRLAADGKSPGISLPIFGGLQGDVPLEPSSGRLIADVVVDRNLTAVIDVSQFESDADKARFATDFAARFFFRKKASPSAVHIFMEEAQEFIPQNPMRDEAKMLHAWTRIQKLGRNFGIGSSLISQRPQEVNKKVLNQTELLFVFQLTGPQEREAVAGWIEEKGIDEDIAAELPKLERGCPHAWSPAWLGISKVVHITEKTTFDGSSTPKVGAKQKTVQSLSPIDLEDLKSKLSASIEKAKAEDPVELRRKIAELQRELKQRPAETKNIEVSVEVPVLKDGQLEAAKDLACQLQEMVGYLSDALAKLNRPVSIRPAAREGPIIKRVSIDFKRRSVKEYQPAQDSSLTGPEQRILDALAWMSSIGIDAPEEPAVAFLAGYTIGGGAWNNPRGALRTKGHLEYVGNGCLRLTDSGRDLARIPEQALTTAELHAKIMARLPGPETRILLPLLKAYPEGLTNEELAAAAGYEVGGGAYNNPRGRLRTLGLIEKAFGGIRARSILFLD